MPDCTENSVPTARYENWICRFCSEGFHNLASLEVHLNHGKCEEKYWADRGEAPWRVREETEDTQIS